MITQRGIYRLSNLVWRSGLAAVLHFTWPLLMLYLALKVQAWKVTAIVVPDMGYWLETVALIVFFKGLLEIVII